MVYKLATLMISVPAQLWVQTNSTSIMSDQSSNSSDSQEEGAIRTAVVTVQALSRLRSLSGNFFTPAGFGRIRRESGPPSIPEATASTPTSSLTSTGSQTGSTTGSGSNKYVRTVLVLTSTCLYYEAQGWKREVLLEDLIGAVVSPKPSNNLNACELLVHYYPVIFSRAGKRQGRKRLIMTVQFDSEASLEENEKMAEEWKALIRLESQRVVRREFCFTDESKIDASDEEVMDRRFLVLINPVGGQGKAVNDFEKVVKPLFDLAEIKYDVIVTERQNHGRDLIKTYDLSKVDGIVIASGDGLLYEVINGIMERENWETAILTPVGMLPTGSGNALCASTLHESEEEFGLVNAAFQIIRGGVIPNDLATVQIGEGYKCYMSLLQAWGMIADIDIESEKFRKIGESRFVLGALSCLVRKARYSGKISYLPFEENQASQSSDPTNAQQDNDHTNGLSSEEPQDQIDAENSASDAQLSSPTIDQTDDVRNEAVPTTAESVESGVIPVKSRDQAMTKSPYGPKADLLPPLSDPLPSNWKTVENEFLTMTALMIPHMASGMFGDPNLTIGTKKISIVLLNYTMTRMDMLQMLLNTDKGVHVNMNGCTVLHAKAFRLEPATPSGLMTVDGEVIPYGPVQTQIHTGMARVMCRKRRSEGTTQ